MSERIEQVPMTVQSRGRLYTSERQRHELGITEGYGRGVEVEVGLVSVERDPPWDGIYTHGAAFETALAYYGELHIPEPVMTRLDLSTGDSVRVTIQRV